MNGIFSVDTSFPPSLAQQPAVAMLTVMSFWCVFLICLQWIYETIEQSRDNPAPPRSYIRTIRRVRLWLVGAALVLTTPRLGTLMLWQLMTPWEREALSVVSWVICIPAAIMVAYAWWTNRAAVKTEDHFAAHRGHYLVEPTTKSEKKRGAIVLLVVFAIAFATTFVRPAPDVHAPRSPITQRR